MQNINKNKLIAFGLFISGALYFILVIFSNRVLFSKRYDPAKAEKTYGESQWQQSQNVAPDKARDEWAIKNHYSGWSDFVSTNKTKVDINKVSEKILKDIGKKVVSDSFLYTYVGYKYANGTNPSLLNPEHPPLAKYLIGYSIHIFGNEHVIGIIIAAASLLLVAVVSFQISGSLPLAGLSFFLTSVFSLFTDQIVNGPQLELYQLFFFLLTLYFLLRATGKRKLVNYIPAGLSFGLLLATKTFLPFFVLFTAWIVYSFWKQWKVIILIMGIGLLTFTLTYWHYFVLGGTLRTFLGLQKYIVVFYGHASIPLLEFAGNYLRLIFTGTWKFWDSARSVSFYAQWDILWPTIFVLGLWKMKSGWIKGPNARLVVSFLILYNLFVFITPIFPRYLLLLFIPMIILL